jgi:hypothetical protein
MLEDPGQLERRAVIGSEAELLWAQVEVWGQIAEEEALEHLRDCRPGAL